MVITASHNPTQYNGYKVYGSDGCQITTQASKAIQAEIDGVDLFRDVKRTDFDTAMAAGIISYIGENIMTRYLAAVGTASILPEGVKKDVAIVYTPLNGAGISCVPRCLRAYGFTNITIPAEQKNPDGNFPTCPYPNPEIWEAMEVGLHWAKQIDSDLLLATDPDCDRVGAAVKNEEDGYTLISGNEMGVLLLDFICKIRIANGTMPEKPVAVKTIVTTPMAKKIADRYGVELRDVLTGFKFIGEQITLLERMNEVKRYIFGFEESCGYLSGSFVRDKDGVNACLMICEMFVWYRAHGKSLMDVLEELYQTYGFYESKQLSFQFEGPAGYQKIQNLMECLRLKPLAELAGFPVERIVDYQRDETGLPRSDVLRYFLADGAEVVVRPSGTEPKLKVYLTEVGKDKTESAQNVEQLACYFTAWVNDK